jgi:hypothetical protein
MPDVMKPDNNVGKGDNVKSFELVCTELFQSTSDKKDVISTVEIIAMIKLYCQIEDVSEKTVKTTFSKLNLGVHGRYTINGSKRMGYGQIKIRQSALQVIRDNRDDIEE